VPHSSRWRWRAFAPAFEQLNPYLPGQYAFAHDVYLVSMATGVQARMSEEQICIEQVQEVQHGVERWAQVFAATFPICQRDIREVCRWLGCPPPSEFFSAEYDRYTFLTDVASAVEGLRVVGVNTTRCAATLDMCAIERAVVNVAGHAIQTAAVSAPELYDVRRCLRRLRVDHLENVSYAAFLQQVAPPMAPVLAAGRSPSQPRAGLI
jgi:hypothetical protein